MYLHLCEITLINRVKEYIVKLRKREFNEIGHFNNNLAYVKKDQKYGYINPDGKIVLPFIYDYASNFDSEKAFVCQKGKYKYINAIGNEVLLKDEDLDPLYNDAKELINSTGRISIAYVQRMLQIGYNRTGVIFEQLRIKGDFPTD